MQEILINIEAGERRVAILHSKKLEWYFVERIANKRIVGDIYKGKVSSVLDGMGAAFVDCGLEKSGFLYVSDITAPDTDDEYADLISPTNGESHERKHEIDPRAPNAKISAILKKGEDILVQIVKEGIGTKGARLTTHFSLPGRYLVLMPTSKRIGVSRRIRDEAERHRIKSVLNELRLPKDMGVVARTAAVGCDKKEFLRDIKYLLDTYNQIKRTAQKTAAPALIFKEIDLSSKIVRDFLTEETEKVVVDDIHEFKKLRTLAARIVPKLKNKIIFHNDHEPLFEKHGVEDEIDKLFERKIYLKCGGDITIEQTEGMVAIDVNSGRFTGKKNLEDTIFKVNCEAAEEIARQLRLRDVGGIIIIDFIDMESKSHRREVFSILHNALKKDKAKAHVISMSELDIVEMTRQRVRRSLESVSYHSCPYCGGKGMVKSAATMAIVAMRKLKAFLKLNHKKKGSIDIFVHPDVAQRLVNEDVSPLDLLRKRFRRHIAVVSDDKLHVEDINIEFAK